MVQETFQVHPTGENLVLSYTVVTLYSTDSPTYIPLPKNIL